MVGKKKARVTAGLSDYKEQCAGPSVPKSAVAKYSSRALPERHILAVEVDANQHYRLLASQVHDVIRSFHSCVASPLASIGLHLEVLRMNSETSSEVNAELAKITRDLDDVITTVRQANRSLRAVEKRILENDPAIAEQAG